MVDEEIRYYLLIKNINKVYFAVFTEICSHGYENTEYER